jgi:hypothetical protein
MLNFTPPIKASLFTSIIYLVCFQLFLHSGNYMWLYPANALFFVCAILYVLHLNKLHHSNLSMPALAVKGIGLSFISSLLSLGGAMAMLAVNYYLLQDNAHLVIKNFRQTIAIVFANSFLVNLVCGSLAAFFTAGLMNEKNYESNSKPLPSVKR